MNTKKSEATDTTRPNHRRTIRLRRALRTAALPLLLLVTAELRGQSPVDGFDPNTDDRVTVIVVQPDGKVLLGGNFTSLSPNGGASVIRGYIARVNSDGTLDSAFNPLANGEIHSIALQADGKVLVGGVFTNIGGQPRNHIARLDATTGLADSFDPNANDSVLSIVVQTDGKILAGGGFTGPNSIGGQTRKYIARLDPTTGLADSYNPNANNAVGSIAVQADGKILVAGYFNGPNSIGGQFRNRLARLDPLTGLADAFDPNANFPVYCIAVQADGKVLAGGEFTSIGGQMRNFFARLDATTGLADSFDPHPDIYVSAIAVQTDGKILAGGSFAHIGGQQRSRLARLDATTGLVDTFDPNPNNSVNTIVVQADGKILVGGAFVLIGGQLRNNVARVLPCSRNAIVDGGFENGGIPSSNWDPETSTNFGTPLCDFASCGNGDGASPPRTGLIWAWFGGIDAPETATLGQTVTIPSDGMATLHFWMRIGTVTEPFTDVLNVRVDGTIVQSYPEPAMPEQNYTERVIDLSAYSDGAAHQLLFEYVGSSSGTASYVVDDVSLIVTGCETPAVMGNISTRLRVETGENALIGGFIVTGTQPKRVIVRAIGPSLPVAGALADPILELRDSSGGLIRSNDNWRSDQEAEIIATTIPPSNDLESAIVETLPANNSAYTAIVRGVNNGTGVGLIEAYDLDRTVNSKLANISTRGLVQTGENVLIAGTIVLGQAPQRVLVRAIGPSLPVAGKLEDPTLELRDGNGTLIRSNDNWRSDQEAEIIATTIPPSNDLESALIEVLPANGADYTAIVLGVNNSTGVGLVEVYALN